MSVPTQSLILPDWPAPASVRACVTTCEGGVSLPPFDTFNLGDHVGDDPAAVAENRRRLAQALRARPAWLKQVHGVAVADADPDQVAQADASWTDRPGIACCVMTADCLPVLFCDRAGTRVAAAHAGWRGLAGGILEATLERLALAPQQVLVWLGPAIGPQTFEVGLEVREAFVAAHPQAALAFTPGQRPDKLIADIYALARIRLAACGVTAVYGGGLCTVTDARFFSYRRTPQGGRFASLVWLDAHAAAE
ncbi:peptidoglycan editing factor PgeF [Pseudomonas sp. S75]|uniref:peptidoglycan editing factor PgeF n=1 Tax=unclassified Pseudomonas TaxID=196821 RepID=UPI0019071202|nr:MULTISPECIES: peptidoglycan editing factor PgeF [unclassified Pseudomonas]MBJ9976307.1 peptidoglycan editing factor PgeF [Pseudomonas sp. S30]MBK0156070.1 peptidoglycan editing factor PgeF [Pseudomonas sp. S75]